MPIPGITQPERIDIDGTLRLRKFDNDYAQALVWYQDPETVRMVDGREDPYTPQRLQRMYDYLAARGELWWIEIDERLTKYSNLIKDGKPSGYR